MDYVACPVTQPSERIRALTSHRFVLADTALPGMRCNATQGKWLVKCVKFHQHLCKISSRSECGATPGTPASTMKEGWLCRQRLSSCFEDKMCKMSSTFVQNFIKIRIRATLLVQFFNCYISKTTASMFTLCESFISIGRMDQDRNVGQHQV